MKVGYYSFKVSVVDQGSSLASGCPLLMGYTSIGEKTTEREENLPNNEHTATRSQSDQPLLHSTETKTRTNESFKEFQYYIIF